MLVLLVATLLLLRVGGDELSCEPWCHDSCTELNGDIQNECGGCSAEYACHPHGPGFPGATVGSELRQLPNSPSMELRAETDDQITRQLDSYEDAHPLHAAAAFGEGERLMQLLAGLEEEARLALDDNGWSALHIAALDERLSTTLDTLAAGSSLGVALVGGGVDGALGLLEFACLVGNAPFVRWLLHRARHGPPIDPAVVSRAESIAWSRGHAQVTSVLQQARANGVLPRAAVEELRGAAATKGSFPPAPLAATVEAAIEECSDEADRAQAVPPVGTGTAATTSAIRSDNTAAREPQPKSDGGTTAVYRLTATDLLSDESGWRRRVYSGSKPAIVSGLASRFTSSDAMTGWTLDDFARRWGGNPVMLCYSPNHIFNKLVRDARLGAVLRSNACHEAPFGDFVRELQNGSHGRDEFLTVSQSPSVTFSEFGVPMQPPGIHLDAGMHVSRNVWAAHPPHTSALHSDVWDALMLQLSGTKRWALIRPNGPRANEAVYMPYLRKRELIRQAPGVFNLGKYEEGGVSNFPLVNVTHPDLQRHPLFARADVMHLELRAGDALMLPAFWLHQVESDLDGTSALNMAVNYWWRADEPGASTSHTQLRISHLFSPRLHIECSEEVLRSFHAQPVHLRAAHHPCELSESHGFM
jgi:hypothetical protein